MVMQEMDRGQIPENPSDDEVREYTHALADQIAQSGFEPDYIIGISRGGWLPAMYLSLLMKWKPFATIDVKKTEDGKGTIVGENPHINRASIKGKSFLLVEDMFETGRTAEGAKGFLGSLGASDVRTACYFARDFAEVKPDFVLRSGVTHEIFFPWERFRGKQ
ncbi:MAG: phosphoribosyltransferase [Patescibacteria group bacterium]|nr:phosphoribosyltransferase [Patescibacteria group bacterium]